ncbi:MAG: FAD-linked oxidase C-terminal domain-containing protein [Aquisalimonadaceae bacterium]
MGAENNESRQTALSELRQVLDGRLSTSEAVREQHGHDESWHPGVLPDAVAFAQSTEEISEILRICHRHGMPVIPFGAGTSYEGHLIPTDGGISLDVSGMNEILQVNAEDMDVVVQPGVRRKQLNAWLADTGLFFPVDPGADATLGGMCATRASGTNAVRYRAMSENVLALTVVLADGRIIKTGSRARKSAAGYDLTRLFIGSEGTLGVITEITLRLYGRPEAMASAVCSFETLEGAVNTAIQTIQMGIPIARVELLDEVMMGATIRYSKLDLPERPTLFLEFHGSTQAVAEQAEEVAALAQDNGGGEFRWTTLEEERSALWQARHDCAYACKALRPGCENWATDVCVPPSRLTEIISYIRGVAENSFVPAPILGHVGDGNFHMVFVIDPANREELVEAERINDLLVAKALEMGGTCTGEHGIGLGKMAFLEMEQGEGVEVMRTIKQALDPKNIMNPGKIFNFQAGTVHQHGKPSLAGGSV